MGKENTGNESDALAFTAKLGEYKKLIDEDINIYAQGIRRSTKMKYGTNSQVAVDAYLDVLTRGGKRIRGALTIVGFEMCGGERNDMIIKVARAVEMIHAYILILDDINDCSRLRRGKEAAHVMLAKYHNQHHLRGDSDHFGESIAINAAIVGNHAAQTLLANLDAEPEARLKVLSVLNQSMLITGHGQINDIFNEVSDHVDEEAVNKVMQWKTAHYTFLNPLHIGMILAGADCAATDAITPFAISAGRAFQITDDILGIFGDAKESGKNPMDDIREGKRNLLTVFALAHAKPSEVKLLNQSLGNNKLTQRDFEECRRIIVSSGALKHAQNKVQKEINNALESLKQCQDKFKPEPVKFLGGMLLYLKNRRA